MNKLLMLVMMAQSIVAKGKAYFDGVSDFLSIAGSADFNFSTGGVCIEGFFQLPDATSPFSAIIGTRTGDGSSTIKWGIYTADGYIKTQLYSSANANIGLIAHQTLLESNVKYHYALVRNSNVFTLYLDGVASSTTVTSSAALGDSTSAVKIGNFGASVISNLAGYITGARITKSDARYTSNFTPPTELSVDSANVKLCMRFAEAIGATTFIDDTGKTVTTNGNVVIVE